MNSARRAYDMSTRSEAAAATGAAILAAFTELFVERGYARVALREVAERAGVSVQTVLRRYGDKDGLTAAAAAAGAEQVADQRRTARPGDLPDIVDNLLDHYDAFGRVSLRLLAEEDSTPAVAPVTETGRRMHREWCATVFAPWLTDLDDATHARRLAQLVAVCDVYTWKLLHLDSGLPRPQVRQALLEMLTPLTHT